MLKIAQVPILCFTDYGDLSEPICISLTHRKGLLCFFQVDRQANENTSLRSLEANIQRQSFLRVQKRTKIWFNKDKKLICFYNYV